MKEYLKSFLLRGAIFGGFGPIIVGIIYLILSFSVENFNLSGCEAFFGIISTYFLAFIQAGASIFNQIEKWSVGKSLLVHLSTIYVAYIVCYLVNTWIPFEWIAILIFTVVFIVVYFSVWLTVFLIVKSTSKKLNSKL